MQMPFPRRFLLNGWVVFILFGILQVRAETLVFKDGQILTGQVKGKAGSLVIFLPDGESRTRMIEETDIAEIRKPGAEAGPVATDSAPGTGGPAPSAASPLDDARFEESIVRAGRNASIPEDRAQIRELMQKRWNHACSIPSNKWNAVTRSLLGRGVSTNVNHDNPQDKAAEVKYRLNGEWVYSNLAPSNALPTTAEGITECWQKLYSSTRTDGMLIWYSANSRAFSTWRKLTWDPDENRWVFTTLEAKRACVADFRKWLEAERETKRKEAARGPNAGNLKWAGDYARRLTEARNKLAKGAASEQEARQLEFTIRSSGENAYERLVLAFDAEFERRALDQFHATFNRRNPLAPEAWGQ